MFDLALALGKHVHEIECLPSSVIEEWSAYSTINPFTEWRGDLRSAILCRTLVGAFTGQDIPLNEFIPEFTPKVKKQVKTTEELEIIFRSFVASHNAGLE